MSPRPTIPTLALIALIALTAACRHAGAPPPTLPRDDRPCQRLEQTIGVGELAFGPVLAQPGTCARGGAAVEKQLRAEVVAHLARSGCFARVVDLEVEDTPVELTVTATVAHLEACTYTAQTAGGDGSDGATVVGTVLFGVVIGAAVAASRPEGTGGWAEAQLVDVSLRSAERSLWRRGVVSAVVREGGKVDSALDPDALLGRVSALTARDLGRKITRVARGVSPYGLLPLDEHGEPTARAEFAIITGNGEDEAAARATIPSPLVRQLGPGYPLVWSADRFDGSRAPSSGAVSVVGLFATMEDAADWVLSRQPRVPDLKAVIVRRAR